MGIKDNPVIFLLSKTWEFSKGNRVNVVIYFILSALARGVEALFPLVIAKILNIIQLDGLVTETIYILFGYLSLYVILDVLFWLFHGPSRFLENINAFFVKANYEKYMMDGTMALPAEWHVDHHSGDTIDKVQKGSNALFNFASNTYDVVEVIFQFLTSYFILIYFHSYSAIIVLLMVIITAFIISKFDKILVPILKQLNYAANLVSAKVFDALSNINTVIILRIEKLVTKSIVKQILKPFTIFKRYHTFNEIKWFAVTMCTSTMMFFVLGSYLYQNYVAGTTILIGTLFALYGYVDRINQLFFRMAWKYGEIVKRRTRVANAEEISNEFKKQKRVKKVRLNGWRQINIKNLVFSYHIGEGADVHLDDIDMEVKRNQRIALIGHSGSGKTTFMKIVRDIYQPRLGDIYIDNKLLKDGFGAISHQISLIPQEPEIFSTTIKGNITLGVSRKLAEIKHYTDMARFTDVVERLPKKLNSLIYEKGVNLSGGEKQRLALARGLLASKDKSIVLMDESTSSVDMRNEYSIYQNIFNEFKNKTIIASIHRLHLLPLFDKIYFFKNGKIICSGTFEEMLTKSKEFNNMWQKYVKTVKKS